MALKEVSCQIIPFLLKSLEEKNISSNVLIKDIPYNLDYLLNKKSFVEWDTMCKILSNLREVLPEDDNFIDIGKTLTSQRLLNINAMIAGFFVNLKDIYRLINDPKKGYGNQNVKCITPSSREVEEGHIEVRMNLPDGYENCKEFFLIAQGFFIALPQLMKLKPSIVKMNQTQHGAIYNIFYPQTTNRFSLIKSFFTSPSSKRAAINELNDAYELLYDRFHQLEDSKEQIQLQTQLLETAYKFTQLIRGDLELDDTLDMISKSILDLDEFEAVEIRIDVTMEGEQFVRYLRKGNPENEASQTSRNLEAHNQNFGTINIWLNPKSNNVYIQRLLDYILPPISMEILNSLSFKLLADYRNELEKKVSVRTKQLHKTNRALTDSLNKLKDLKTARDGFFAAISHEFRTPLTLILGPIEKIITNSPEAETKKKAKTIWRNANRMLALVNQLLDLSRLDYGKLELKAAKGNIVDFVRGLLYSFESLADSKEITLKLFNEDDYIELYFDDEVMMKIITNLLSNAFKFTDAGGMISIQIVKINNTSVEIRIKDTGIGISESDLSKLFDRFYQVDQSLTRKYEGSGIGLALTKELVQLHHGKIFVESKPRLSKDENSGWTEFRLEFPLGTSHFTDDEITKDDSRQKIISASNYLIEEISPFPEVSKEELPPDDKTIVLVVEDNPDLREMIKENLLDNYSVLEAENGVKGFKLAEDNIPDLIISDIMMPEMDGYELTKKLKTSEKTNHIPVILLTAKAATEDKLEGLETGADDYLIKPFNEKELSIRVRNLIKIRQQMREKYLAQSMVKPGSVVVPSSQKIFIEKLTSIVESNISNESFSVEVLCREIGMSRTQLHRKIKSITNQSTTEFIRNFRLQMAADLLKQDAGNIAEISNKVGFSSQAYFTKLFQELYGLTPLEYKKQHSK